MIKYIQWKNKSFEILASEYYELLKPQLIKRIAKSLRNVTNPTWGHILYWLIQNNYENLEMLITSNVELLQEYIYMIDEEINSGKLNAFHIGNDGNVEFSDFGKFIYNVFNYDYIRQKEWFIDFYKDNSFIPVCPYCNRQYTSIISKEKDNRTILLFDYEHYFSKVYYPFLSLSFYNLIPTCHSCNSSLKNSKKFSLTEYTHPYKDSFNDLLKFSTLIVDTDYFYDIQNYEFTVIFQRKLENSYRFKDSDFERAENFVKFFELKQLYNLHKDYVKEIMLKKIIYPDTYQKYLYETFFGKGVNSRQEFARLILGNYVTDEDLDKRPLAKLTKDIAEQHSIIK